MIIWPKAPNNWLPVQVAGSLPELTQRRIARSSAFLGGAICCWLLPPPATGCGRGGHLAVGLRYVCVVDVLLLLLEGLRFGDLLRGGLLAGGEELLQCAAGHVGVLHQSVGQDVVGMADHAGCVVGGVADVAVLDEHALAAADVDQAWGQVLRDGEGGGEESEQRQDAQVEEAAWALATVVRRRWAHR